MPSRLLRLLKSCSGIAEHVARSGCEQRRQVDRIASYYYLGLALQGQGNDKEAIKFFRPLILNNPQRAASLNEGLGVSLMKEGQKEEARKQLTLAQQLWDEDRSRLQLHLMNPD